MSRAEEHVFIWQCDFCLTTHRVVTIGYPKPLEGWSKVEVGEADRTGFRRAVDACPSCSSGQRK